VVAEIDDDQMNERIARMGKILEHRAEREQLCQQRAAICRQLVHTAEARLAKLHHEQTALRNIISKQAPATVHWYQQCQRALANLDRRIGRIQGIHQRLKQRAPEDRPSWSVPPNCDVLPKRLSPASSSKPPKQLSAAARGDSTTWCVLSKSSTILTSMLLSPDITYQQARFPAAWQLYSRERQALQAQLPKLTGALRRVSSTYLGTGITIGTPELLWQESELGEIEQVTGATLVSRFGGSSQMVTIMPQALAVRCVGPLLGYSTKLELSSEELTGTDLAILQPYLEALADTVLGALFGRRGRHQMLPADAPQSRLAAESFAVAIPLATGTEPHRKVMSVPTAAWRNHLAADSEPDPARLKCSQLHALPVCLEAVLPAPSLELTELQALARGDVLLLPNSRKMIGQLQAAGRLVAAGQVGAQGGQLSIRLLAANTYSGSHTAMNEHSNTTPESEQQLSSARTPEAPGTGETNLESPDGIPVAIQIRLGQVVMPLGKLQELRAGAVVPL